MSSKCCKIPSTNREFWVAKIRRERDQKNYRILQENGRQVIVICECQLKSAVIDHTMREVELLLNNNLIERYKKQSPIPYTTEEESYPIAVEDRE